jgi:hypothetical protein
VRRLAVVVGLGGLALAAACASLTGLSGGDGTAPAPPPEAGAEAAPLEAAPPATDPCSHATVPPPPAKDDDPTGQVPTLVLAVRAESVSGAVDGGAPIGLDLDGVCSCFPDPTTAHGGSPSCIAPEGGAPACDGDGGVDRQISALLAAYTVPSLSGTSGGPTLLFKVTKYNGRANDSEVFVGLIASPGVFDGSGCPGAAEAGAAPYPPTWQGCDLFALDESSVLPGTNEPLRYQQGYVTNHVLVVPPSANPVPFIAGNTSLAVSGSVLAARLVALDAQLQPIDPPPDVGTLFRMEGITAGRVNTADGLRAIAKGQAMTDGGPLCGFPNFYNSVKNTFICPSADIATSPADDFKPKDCDALSLAAAFSADPAMLGVARKPDESACGDPADPKYASFFDCAK